MIRVIYRHKRKLRAQYEIIWTNSCNLQPQDVLGLRGQPAYGFRTYYYERPTDRTIKERLANSQNLLVVGKPLAGKTRAIYQALINAPKSFDVIIPRLVDVNLEDFRIPWRLTFWRQKVLLLNDLDKYLEKQNVKYLIQGFLQAGAIIAASCRAGGEYKKVLHELGRGDGAFRRPRGDSKVGSGKGPGNCPRSRPAAARVL